jgi:hypothetical protein
VPATRPYPEPSRSNPYPTPHFLKIHLHFTRPSTSSSSKLSLSVRGSYQNAVYAKRDILHARKGRKVNWIGHILRGFCFLKHVILGTVQGTGKRGEERKQVLYDLQNKRRYRKLKEKAVDSTLWRTRFGDCLRNGDKTTIECNYFPAQR